MKNYRVVEMQCTGGPGGNRVTFALQKRIGLLFWYTVAKCNTVTQCLELYDNTKHRKEKVTYVVRKF